MCGLQKREFPFFAAAALGSVLFTHGLSGVSICFIVISCLIGQWSGKELLNSNQLDLVLNDQRRVFSNKYVNFNLFEASCFIIIHEKHPMSSNPFFEPHMLNEIPIILIASKEQQEAGL